MHTHCISDIKIIIPVGENVVAPRYADIKRGWSWVCYSPRALWVLNPGLDTICVT